MRTNRAGSGAKLLAALLPLVLALVLSACGKSKPPIVIGSKSGPEQMLLGEIVAQHLENRLPGVKIERRFGTGGAPIQFQALAEGELTVYAESTGVIESAILKELPNPDPSVVLERVRLEMARTAQLDLFELGFEDSAAVVIRAADASGAVTLSNAARGDPRWRLGVSLEFQSDSLGLPALTAYHLPMNAPVRSMDATELFPALEKGEVNMIVTRISDGHLNSPEWKILQDDKKAFPPQQVCLLVRQDRLNNEPRLRPALGELTGKFTLDVIRMFDQKVEVAGTPAPVVAAEFLKSVGLR